LAPISRPIVAEDTVSFTPPRAPAPDPGSATGVPAAETALRDSLAKTVGDRIVSARIDPRDGRLSVTFEVDTMPAKPEVAQLAKSMLQSQPDCQYVTTRFVKSGQIIYIADVRRSSLQEFEQAEKTATPEEWAAMVIENEWPNSTRSEPGP
jgi:hypothetical protein